MAAARKDMAETAAARSNVYGLLAGVFRAEPTGAVIQEMRTPGFSQVFSGLGLSLGEELHSACADQVVEDLASEYTRLFIGPGPHLSPHESVHVKADNLSENTFWGPQTVEVKRFVEASGLRYEKSFTGLPDHIAVELELMQRLTERESQAWAEGEEDDARWCQSVQTRFFEDHLVQWVPEFCDKVVDMAEMTYFSEMASLTKSFLGLERELLHERPEEGR